MKIALFLTSLALNLQAGTSAVVAAQARSVPAPQVQRILASWSEDLKQIDALLLAGEGKKAHRRVTVLIDEMAERFIGGPGVGEYLGTATVLKALAAYLLGEKDEALWHWHVAHQMFPHAANFTLSAYGDAGPYLKARPPRQSNELPPLSKQPLTKRPKKIRAPSPRIPAARRGGEPVSVVVQAVIGIDGNVREPVILKSEGELTLVCATLETLRHWRFEPAEAGGEKTPVVYFLTVNFRP